MRSLRLMLILVLCGPALLTGGASSADPPAARPRTPLAGSEHSSPHYPSTPYADIASTLTTWAASGDRLRIEQIGRSAGGRPLLLATVSSPENLARLRELRDRRRAMIAADPRSSASAPGDLPAIVLVNASSRGNVYAGADAALAIVSRLTQEESEEVARILDNVVLLVNVVPNPDGRVVGTRGNAADLEPARDLVAQSQPETQALIALLAEWSPMVVLDVDGFESPMTIGIAPPPRQIPTGDLYLAWSLDIAHAMSAAIHTASGCTPDAVALTPEAAIGDWPPLDLATYATYHGAYGLCLTLAARDETGVAAIEAAITGALAFVSRHRAGLVDDQACLLRDGLLRGAPPFATPIPPPGGLYTLHTMSATPSGVSAYLIPADGEHQQDRHEAADLVNLLIANGLTVERTRGEVTTQYTAHPPGTYLVRLDQPLGALAHALLWVPGQAQGTSPQRAASGWSLPLARGVTCLPVDAPPDVPTERVFEADPRAGTAEPGPAAGYAYGATSNAAIAATNALLDAGVPLLWASEAFAASGHDYPAGTFILPTNIANPDGAVALLTTVYGIDLGRVPSLPSSLARLRPARIAALAEPGVAVAMRDLGFDVTTLTTKELVAGHALDGHNVLIVAGQRPVWARLSPSGRDAISAYLRRDGRLIGIGAAGADLAVAARLADLDTTITSPHFAGLAAITCDRGDPVTAAYPEHTALLAHAPVWFTYLPNDATPVAHLSPAGHLLTGYWPVWDDINPAGQPIIVHVPYRDGFLTLFGIDPTYAAYDRHAYRLLARAIYRTMASCDS